MDPTSITLFSLASAAIAIVPTIVLIVQHIHKKRKNQSNTSTPSDFITGCTEANHSSTCSDTSEAAADASPRTDNKAFHVEAPAELSASNNDSPVLEAPRPPPPTRAPSPQLSSPSGSYPLHPALFPPTSSRHPSIPPPPPPPYPCPSSHPDYSIRELGKMKTRS